ncbi:MAG: DegT/DnrJ/EryC1/StrS family aminotransferase, partial [Candidatus Dadabacteria bacterium]|nr:DegT/DnrJ/EryC1/StrS family aminotransferase [Candidatus Dadabacteria bacterium]
IPPEKAWAKNVYWLYTIMLETAFGPDSPEIAGRLAADGIDTRRVFVPMHLLPMYSTRRRFPVSEKISQNGLSLPSSPTLAEKNIDYICDKIRMARHKQ